MLFLIIENSAVDTDGLANGVMPRTPGFANYSSRFLILLLGI